MGFRVLLSVAILSSYLMINVLGGGFDPDHVSWTQAPHHSPSYPPTGAPAPHHRHPKRPGGHHHKPAVPPTAHTPTVAPVHPPTVSPVHPPKVAPVHPPRVAPVHPPSVAPVHPPKVVPVHPPKVAPVHPPKVAPVHPPTVAPVHPPKVSPVHPPKVAPVHPPKVAPVHPPTVAPVHPPTKAPVHPPAPPHSPLPTRRQVAVRGMVYCKACKYKGIDTLMAATPLPGAVVLLTCRNTKYPLRVKATTDKNGFFFIMPPKTLTTYGAHKCKVTVLSSPQAKCSQATNLHYGLKGATLIPTPKPVGSGLVAPPLPYDVFTVGPFAFEAPKKTQC